MYLNIWPQRYTKMYLPPNKYCPQALWKCNKMGKSDEGRGMRGEGREKMYDG